VSTGRLEAFSDGVIAIAITLLVLDIRVPEPGEGSLGHALAQQWPNYAAYAVSFITIGIVWINHHGAIARIRRADHGLLILNLLLLLTIGILPFTTSLMAAYLREGEGEKLAAAVYAGSFLLMGCAFFALHRYALSERRGVEVEGVSGEMRRQILRRNAMGLAPYALATAIAAVSPYATLAICAAVALYYALPGEAGQREPRPRSSA
jgi:uncharacterized membrane protein